MQVEVSKYTEGINDRALRLNGLPKSLIRYDARQMEEALTSNEEAVQIVKHPKSHSISGNNNIKEEQNLLSPVNKPPTSAEINQAESKTDPGNKSRKPTRVSLVGRKTSTQMEKIENEEIPVEMLMTKDVERRDSWETNKQRDIRQGIDLGTTLERIEKNFVISDPRHPDCPIIFASDSFLELTEYSREEILGRNCRFLQGPEIDQATVQKIRDAIRESWNQL